MQQNTPDTGAPRFANLKTAAITAFIVFHLVAIFSWSVPLNSLLVTQMKKDVEPYMLWSGLFQTWDMFSPDPPNINAYVEAEITYADGASRVWKFPRMQELGLVERYLKERYRKWGNERVRLDANAILWPDAARYIARLNNDRRQPPKTVRLVRYWSMIPPPGVTAPRILNHYAFFSYPVTPEDLQ